ncbi:hypothetical protein F2Q68_00005213 [Brassica cretica]|uniref:Uncharacterized protein n=1 Tax=Brassica cretica TaxID=69181 RepID=A0A8S9JHM0_BRACR|nr:hypothetical protein F2Q68_00005213 [Brassica cretica]
MVVSFWCRLIGYFFVSPARRSSEAQKDRARFPSFGSRRQLGPSVESWCLDSPSSQPALSGGLVLPTLFAVHGVLTPPQSTLLRRCHEKSSIRGNEVSPTFLWSTSTVENGDCIFEDLRNRLADGVG